MSRGASIGWSDLKTSAIEALSKERFEEFCQDLIAWEAYERHDRPEIDGTSGDGGPDGGRDLLLTVKNAPATSRLAYQQQHHLNPLTEDARARTAYSCKSGDQWLTLALKDITERKGVSRAVEVLLEGGHFKLLINRAGKLDAAVARGKGPNKRERKPKEHLVDALWERMKEVDPAAADPSGRVEILDVNVIATFLKNRGPEGGALVKWRDAFALRPVLHDLDEWRSLHALERADAPYEGDAPRMTFLRELVEFARTRSDDTFARVAWLVGPPGVGKTRAVLEALLRDASVAQRVRVAFGADDVSGLLDELFERHPAVFLVVDDCSVDEAVVIAQRFRVKSARRPDSHLLVITPAAVAEGGRGDFAQRWELDSLLPDTARALARRILTNPGSLDAASVDAVVRLGEGYPWFITLLVREAEREGRAPRDMREAVRWALASRWEAQGQALEDLRLRRARALLATLLTQRTDWQTLTLAQQESVARAAGLARWEDVTEGAGQCVQRGILRRRLHYKYITPQVLAREVAAWVFGPGGDDPGAKRCAAFAEEFVSELFKELSGMGLPAEVTRAIATAEIEDLQHAGSDWETLRRVRALDERLRFAARNLPGPAARALRAAIEGTGIEELRARVEVRRPLVRALGELTGHREGVDDAAAALFRLALAENEGHADNATATWAALFLPTGWTTRWSVERRDAALRASLDDPAPEVRRVALKGLRAFLTTSGARRSDPEFGGVETGPDPADVRRVRANAWSMLLERLTDSDPDVASAAMRVVCSELRGALLEGLGDFVLPRLAARVDRVDERELRALREVILHIRTFEHDQEVRELPALGELAAALAPATFSRRLRQQVGTWTPGLGVSVPEGDVALAREALADVEALRAELGWLVSDEAVRAHSFVYALGMLDADATLLATMRERALGEDAPQEARELFARYLAGRIATGGAAALHDELQALGATGHGAFVLARALVQTSVDDEQLGWIESAIREGRLVAEGLRGLGVRTLWLRQVSDERVLGLLNLLLDAGGADGASAALAITAALVNEDNGRASRDRAVALRALERSVEGASDLAVGHAWEVCATALLGCGEVESVARLAVKALARPEGSPHVGWRVLRGVFDRDPLAAWRAVSATLERPSPDAGHLLMKFRFQRDSFVWPTEAVLDWVGDDARRGRAVPWLVRPETMPQAPILRGLIERFGPEGSVAEEVLFRVESTDGPVASLADHDRARLAQVRPWLDDSDPTVRAFAQRLVDALERSRDQHEAEEADERRWGT